MSTGVFTVLFLCTGHAARRSMAEAILHPMASDRFYASSAGSPPQGKVHPYALNVPRHFQYPAHGLRSKSWEALTGCEAPPIDDVIAKPAIDHVAAVAGRGQREQRVAGLAPRLHAAREDAVEAFVVGCACEVRHVADGLRGEPNRGPGGPQRGVAIAPACRASQWRRGSTLGLQSPEGTYAAVCQGRVCSRDSIIGIGADRCERVTLWMAAVVVRRKRARVYFGLNALEKVRFETNGKAD